MGTGSFLVVKRPGCGVDHPPLSSAEVKERVKLYLCSSSGPSWPVILPFDSLLLCDQKYHNRGNKSYTSPSTANIVFFLHLCNLSHRNTVLHLNLGFLLSCIPRIPYVVEILLLTLYRPGLSLRLWIFPMPFIYVLLTIFWINSFFLNGRQYLSELKFSRLPN